MKEEFKNADWYIKSPMYAEEYEIGESESGKSDQDLIITSENEKEINETGFQQTPNMWSLNYIGAIYSSNCALYTSMFTLLHLITYTYFLISKY
jgi:hypothetical protein